MGKPRVLFLEYYELPFALFHHDLVRGGYDPLTNHKVAGSFWNVVPPGFYDADDARPIIGQYLKVLEERLSATIRQHSLGYWIHAYRRLFPGPIGEDDSKATIHLVRSTFEAAVHKYATLNPCSGLGFSHQIEPDAIFKGLLMEPRFAGLRTELRKSPQLVLTDFDVSSLRELYELERIAYQVWRCGAALRITGKGAGIAVDPQNTGGFFDTRSDDLNRLVESYDSRARVFGASATGTAFDPGYSKSQSKGVVFLAGYNLGAVTGRDLNNWFKILHLEVSEDFKPNFLWGPFNLAQYCRVHQPYSEAFQEKHGIPLSWAFAVLGALLMRIVAQWSAVPGAIIRYWQRAYEGPHTRQYVIDEIRNYLPMAIPWLEIPLASGDVDIPAVIRFFELTDSKRNQIDLRTRGPMSLFLPFGADRLFIDYAWIGDILFNLFFDVVPDDQNFKGDALEVLVRCGRSVLPAGPCKSVNGDERQVDASFELGNVLVIAECRAFARSFGIETGQPQAIKYRTDKIETALRDADEKAKWLSSNPRGTNYDITRFRKIVPLAVTPFVEFIPSTSPYYWLTGKLPRVLTPGELRDALQDHTFKHVADSSPNAVPLR